MAYKHHQAICTHAQELANEQSLRNIGAHVNVYSTNFTYPSTGIEVLYFNFGDSYSVPTIVDASAILVGTVSNLIFDWEGGGPAGIQSPYWGASYRGYIWGFSTTTDITFRFVYNGSIKLKFSSDPTTAYSALPVVYNDWDYTGGGEVSKSFDYVTTITNNSAFATSGAVKFSIDFWNSAGNPHIVAFIKRNGIDDDFKVLSASTVEKTYSNIVKGAITTAPYVTIKEDLQSFSISRDKDQISTASFEIYVDTTNNYYAYDSNTDSFGPITKGRLVEIFAGYSDKGLVKRFVGNVTKSIEVQRDEYGSTVSVSCEGILAHSLDTLNFNFPNHATYSHAGYTDNNDLFTRPDGISRPDNFDQWQLYKAVISLLVQSGIDPYYLYQKREYLTQTNDTTEGTTNLINDIGIVLSRPTAAAFNYDNVNFPEIEPIWQFDFGQDSVYDIIKQMLDKYGFYIKELEGGSKCGCIELISIKAPTVVKDSINEAQSSNYLVGQIKESAEGYKGVVGGTGNSSIVIDWTGSGIDLLMGLGPDMSDVTISYKVTEASSDWTPILGFFNDGSFYQTDVISTSNIIERFFYDGVNVNTGYNPNQFGLVFNEVQISNIYRALDYGSHKLLIRKTDVDHTMFFDSILVYDYGYYPYKKYSTQNNIQQLSLTKHSGDIRNDIIVLGASTASFAFPADEDNLNEVKSKFITSRIVDTRSIHDPTYKYYVGREKKFVIEDPTITTQERADWLALYTLYEYRKPSETATIEIPADIGLQVYDSIYLEDVKTGSVDPSAEFFVESFEERFSVVDGYRMSVTSTTRGLPVSFRPRQWVTAEELSLYFNNRPFAFEKIIIPVVGDNTAYDPMSSEDGKYIELEWTLLVPGVQAIEVWDNYNIQFGTDTSHYPNYGNNSGDRLIAVLYFGKSADQPGKYKSKWDGVHEHFEANDKFKESVYETVYKMPVGTGYFVRGQNTLLVDQVHPLALEEKYAHLSGVLAYFPLYIAGKYQPVNTEYTEAKQTYIFGTEGETYINGTLNSDTSEFSIVHFNLEERIPLVWDFANEYIHYPTDWSRFVKRYADPVAKAAKYSDTSNDIYKVFIADPFNSDFTDCTCLCYDAWAPYKYDSTWSEPQYFATTTIPIIDETVGIRVFQDKPINKRRRFYLNKADLVYTVLTQIIDTAELDVDIIRYRIGSLNSYTRFYNQFAIRGHNLLNVQSLEEGQPISDFVSASQKLKLENWNYLPTWQDRTTDDSIIFKCNLSQYPISVSKFAASTVRPDGPYGLGVGKVFAVPISELGDLDLADLVFSENPGESSKIIPRDFDFEHSRFTNALGVNSWQKWAKYDPKEACRGSVAMFYDRYIETGHSGRQYLRRKVYNSVLVSLDMFFTDRAGRVYFSPAKVDTGNILIGKRNNIELHSQFSLHLLKYVNRYNPYMPTACYMERSPITVDMTSLFFSATNRNTYTVRNNAPNYSGLNLSTKIINDVPLVRNANIIERGATTVCPLWQKSFVPTNTRVYYDEVIDSFDPLTGRPSTDTLYFERPHLSVANDIDGKTAEMFGTIHNKSNTSVYIREQANVEISRDNTAENQRTAYYLPTSLGCIGAHPNFPYPRKKSEYNDLDTTIYYMYPFHLQSYIPRTGYYLTYLLGDDVDRTWHYSRNILEMQTAGLSGYLDRMPIFTLVASGECYKTSVVGDV